MAHRRIARQFQRRARDLAAVAAMAAGIVGLTAGPAAAHAELDHTSPGASSVVATTPHEVTLTFGESVGVSPDDIRVYDDRLRRVDDGDAGPVAGRPATVGVTLPRTLPTGTYTVSWRVLSADSHPVSGGFTFSIGRPSPVNGAVPGLGGGSRTVGILLGVLRFLGYAGLVGSLGGLAFLLLWPGGRDDPWLRRTITAGLLANVVAAVGLFVVQAPYAQGVSLADAFDGGALSAVAHSHFGHVVMARGALSLLLLVMVLAVGRVRAFARIGRWVVTVVGIALPVTWALAGHGDVGSRLPLSIASESLHVIAISVWLGGIVVLGLRLLPGVGPLPLAELLPRFSRLALGCMVVIVVTGGYQAWREIGLSWTALTTTTYGRLVIAKIVGVVLLLGLGGYARRQLRLRSAEADSDERLRQGVFAELGIGIGVLAVTAILVNTIPARESVSYVTRRALTAHGLLVQTTVEPGRVGRDTIELAIYSAAGFPRQAMKVTGSLSLPARQIASVPLRFAALDGTNQQVATASVPLRGTWRLTFAVQTSRIAATQFTTTFTVH